METLKAETIVVLKRKGNPYSESFKVEDSISFDNSTVIEMNGKTYYLDSIKYEILPEVSLLQKAYCFYAQ